MGALTPSFSDFVYYFNLEVIGFSQLVVALISVLGFINLLALVCVYNLTLKPLEMRSMMILACIINCFGSLL